MVKGEIHFFDGDKTYTLQAGECGVARKNNLAKFIVTDRKEGFEPVLFCFEEPFLRQFQIKHQIAASTFKTKEALIKSYYKGVMELDEAFEDLKYEELLIILLKNEPGLADLFFDFGLPGKLDLEAFMNCNYKFNASLCRFALLTGRSLSAFNRGFKALFDDSPGRWLGEKRLLEAYWFMDK